jgi:nitrate reductase NapE component
MFNDDFDNHFKNFDKKFDRTFSFAKWAFLIWAVIVLAIMGTVGYVIFHFISKFW